MRTSAFLTALRQMRLDQFKVNPKILVSPKLWCIAGKPGESPPRVINGKIDVANGSDRASDLKEVSITGIETIDKWHAMCCGWQFLQFKGCHETRNMESWQTHMIDICVAEKKNQLQRFGSETINSDFRRHCHHHRTSGENPCAPWSVLSDTDYENMPIVVWARVLKKKSPDVEPAQSHPPPPGLHPLRMETSPSSWAPPRMMAPPVPVWWSAEWDVQHEENRPTRRRRSSSGSVPVDQRSEVGHSSVKTHDSWM